MEVGQYPQALFCGKIYSNVRLPMFEFIKLGGYLQKLSFFYCEIPSLCCSGRKGTKRRNFVQKHCNFGGYPLSVTNLVGGSLKAVTQHPDIKELEVLD